MLEKQRALNREAKKFTVALYGRTDRILLDQRKMKKKVVSWLSKAEKEKFFVDFLSVESFL